MSRPRFDSDEKWNDRRRKGPRPGSYYLTHHSVSNHPKMVIVYADNDLYATWHRVIEMASEKGAAHTNDTLHITKADVIRLTQRSKQGPATVLLRYLCGTVGWPFVEPQRDQPGKIVIRNFAKKQNLTTRDKRNNDAYYAASITPSLQHTNSPVVPKPEAEPKPDQPADFVKLWNETCPPAGMPRVRELTLDRRRQILARLKSHPDLDWWREVFDAMTRSPLCTGKVPYANGAKPWRADLDWIVKNDKNAVKVLEGGNHEPQKDDDPNTGTVVGGQWRSPSGFVG